MNTITAQEFLDLLKKNTDENGKTHTGSAGQPIKVTGKVDLSYDTLVETCLKVVSIEDVTFDEDVSWVKQAEQLEFKKCTFLNNLQITSKAPFKLERLEIHGCTTRNTCSLDGVFLGIHINQSAIETLELGAEVSSNCWHDVQGRDDRGVLSILDTEVRNINLYRFNNIVSAETDSAVIAMQFHLACIPVSVPTAVAAAMLPQR